VLAPVAAARHAIVRTRDATLAEHAPALVHDYVVFAGGVERAVSVTLADGGATVAMDGRFIRVAGDLDPALRLFEGEVDDIPVAVQIRRDGPGYRLVHGGASVRALVLDPRAAALYALMPEKPEPDTSKLLLSPMPGLLKAVLVEAGEAVEAAAGASLAADQIILTFEG
ncbi:MAG: hypothetical protein RIM80_00325, partial [Alphaproteobacteria bacterium]